MGDSGGDWGGDYGWDSGFGFSVDFSYSFVFSGVGYNVGGGCSYNLSGLESSLQFGLGNSYGNSLNVFSLSLTGDQSRDYNPYNHNPAEPGGLGSIQDIYRNKAMLWEDMGDAIGQIFQLGANTVQGLQDMAISSVNLIGSGPLVCPYNPYLTTGIVTPKIPDPQWARDLYIHQSGLEYNASKILTSLLITWGIGECIKAASLASAPESIIILNAAQGKEWEQIVGTRLQSMQTDVVEQITLRTQSGVRTRLDFLGNDTLTGETALTEAKSSATAPLTDMQSIAFPEIQQSGAVIVGKGKPPFVGGTQIPSTKVNIVRP